MTSSRSTRSTWSTRSTGLEPPPNINYLDINAQPRRIDNVPLPWTLSVTTTLPSVSVNVVAQTDGDQISCQIIVNDVVKDERSITGVNAETFCIVKSA